MRAVVLVFSIALTVSLAGCSSARPSDGGNFGSVAELKAAYESAGGECSDWTQGNKVTAAAESGECDSDTVLSTYASDGDKQTAVANLKSLSDLIGGVTFLVGGNWIINDSDAANLQKKLGGTVVDTTK